MDIAANGWRACPSAINEARIDGGASVHCAGAGMMEDRPETRYDAKRSSSWAKNGGRNCQGR